MVIEILGYLLILVTAFPVSRFLAWLCDDELIIDRKYFVYFFYCLILVTFILLIFYFNLSMLLSLLYLALVLTFMIPKKTTRNVKKLSKK